MNVKKPDLLAMVSIVVAAGVLVTTALQARTVEPQERFSEFTRIACTMPASSPSLHDLPC